MFLKSDVERAPEETNLIMFFRKDLKPLIKAQTGLTVWEFDTWKEVIDKIVEAKPKTGFYSMSYIREIDYWCQRENRPVYAINIKIQI